MSDAGSDLGDMFRAHRDLVRARKYTQAQVLADQVAARADLRARHPALVERFLAAHRALQATCTKRFEIPPDLVMRSRRRQAPPAEGDQQLQQQLSAARHETERLRRQLDEIQVRPPDRVSKAWKEEREQLYQRISRLEGLAQQGGRYRELYFQARSVLRELLVARRRRQNDR